MILLLQLGKISKASWESNALVFAGLANSDWKAENSETATSKTVEVVVTFAESRAQNVIQAFAGVQGVGKFNTFIDNTFNVTGASTKSYPTGESSLTDLHHMCAVINGLGEIVSVYGNGTEKTVGSAKHSLGGADSYMTVGGTANYTLKGRLHAVRMYNRMLTAEEIASNYASDVDRFGFGE